MLTLYIINVQHIKESTMNNVSISDLRANLLEYLKKAQSGEQITVTSNGHLLATITAPTQQHDAAKKKLRQIAKTAFIGDVLAPIGENWDAMS